MNRNTAASQAKPTGPEHPHLSAYWSSSNLSNHLGIFWSLLILLFLVWAEHKSSILYLVKLQENWTLQGQKRTSLVSPSGSLPRLSCIYGKAKLVFSSCHCNSCRNISSSLTTFQAFPCWVFGVLGSLCRLQPIKVKSSTDQLICRWNLLLCFSCLPNQLNSLTRYVGFLISCSLQAILQICLLCISVFRMTTDILVPSNFVVQTWNSSISFLVTIHSSVILMFGLCRICKLVCELLLSIFKALVERVKLLTSECHHPILGLLKPTD